MIIPYEELESSTLDNLIDYYITTERATCNDAAFDLQSERQKVKQALSEGKCVVEYSQAHETAYIVPTTKFQR